MIPQPEAHSPKPIAGSPQPEARPKPEAGITRLAPSPTGALHLGNARTFLLNVLLARRQGWRVLMRIEDLDGPRVKRGAADQMLDELAWLGLTWDGPIVRQSMRADAYRSALDRLIADGWAYPCVCSRKDAATAGGAPHAEDASAVYSGACRGRFASAAEAQKTHRPVAWRVRVPEEPIRFHDQFAGPQEFDLSATCGDFVIFKSDGLAAYQLAVVVDDTTSSIDAVVRGDDLLESAARQIHLRRLLDMPQEVRYWHLPLVVGPDGRRLAKRHGDTRLSTYRQLGTPPGRILGLLGYWSGLLERRRETSLDELTDRFNLSAVPRHAIIMSPQDDAFLRG